MWLIFCPMNPRQSWILDSNLSIPDSWYWIPDFVSEIWILDSNRKWDSGFLELYSRFQNPFLSYSVFDGLHYLKKP